MPRAEFTACGNWRAPPGRTSFGKGLMMHKIPRLRLHGCGTNGCWDRYGNWQLLGLQKNALTREPIALVECIPRMWFAKTALTSLLDGSGRDTERSRKSF